MTTGPRLFTLSLVLAAAAAALAVAPATARAYEYLDSRILAQGIDQEAGSKVRVIDEVLKIGVAETIGTDSFLRFETHHFLCAIPEREKDQADILRAHFEKSKEGDKYPALVVLHGTIARADPVGPVRPDEAGERPNVRTGPVILFVDHIRPVGPKVKTVDEVVAIYPEDHQSSEGFLRFDTYHFRCAIPTSDTEGIALMRELEEKRAKGDSTPFLLALSGTVARPEIFGKIARGYDDGVRPEQIVLVVDKVEKPRRRYFLEHPDDRSNGEK
jgi:hypothetical protein